MLPSKVSVVVVVAVVKQDYVFRPVYTSHYSSVDWAFSPRYKISISSGIVALICNTTISLVNCVFVINVAWE